jgi:hypothetical protein
VGAAVEKTVILATMSPARHHTGTKSGTDEDSRGKIQQRHLSWALFSVVCVTLLCVVALLGFSLYVQSRNYSAGVSASLATSPINPVAVIAYSRSLDFAIAKMSAICLGFLLIFVGALYVLRTADSDFALELEREDARASLQTSSPGLVMITLGVALVAIAILNKSDVDLGPSAPAAALHTEPGTTVTPATGQALLKPARPVAVPEPNGPMKDSRTASDRTGTNGKRQ